MAYPLWLVRAYLAMLPRLTAEESLQAAERTAMGSGALKKSAYQSVHRRWVRAAAHGMTRPVRPRGAVDPAALAAMGIGVRREAHQP